MAMPEINAPHQRLLITDPNAPTGSPAPHRPGFALRFLIGLLVIPLGIAARVIAQIYMELTQAAVHYQTVFAFVTITHLVLVIATVLALLGWRRRPLMRIFALQMWIGYGIGAALLALKDMG